jgi:flagellar biosynthesis/type III secretory pathway chaperone
MDGVDRLLSVLDEQVELLGRKLSLLRQMADCVKQAELEELAELLQREAVLSADESELAERTAELRDELAGLCDAPADQLTLGRLAEELEDAAAIALNDRRERLLLLAQQVQQQASRTVMLVQQAMELNAVLLAALTGREEGGETYAPDGAVQSGRPASTFHQSV